MLIAHSVQALQNWWLSVWSEATAGAEAAGAAIDTKFYMGAYFGLGLTSLLFQASSVLQACG